MIPIVKLCARSKDGGEVSTFNIPFTAIRLEMTGRGHIGEQEIGGTRVGISKSAGWVWKKGDDGKWHRPGENDQGLVPKQR